MLTMDDEPEKLRRNVVVLSAVPLTVWFLNLKLPDRAFEFDIKQSQDRVWVVLFFALLYAVLRYFHSDESQKGLEAVRQKCTMVIAKVFGKVMVADLSKIRSGERPKYCNDEAIRAAIREFMQTKPEARVVAVEMGAGIETPGKNRHRWQSMVLEAYVSYHAPYSTRDAVLTAPTTFQFPWWLRWKGVAIFVGKTAFGSKELIDIMMPYLLAICAFLVLFVKCFPLVIAAGSQLVVFFNQIFGILTHILRR